MTRLAPYRRRNPGDALRLQDWLEVQQQIKEELRRHKHLGATGDGDAPAEGMCPQLGGDALAPGAVTTAKLAAASVGSVALAPGAIRAAHFDPDTRFGEQAVRFRPSGGHDHDGVGSRHLARGSVATSTLADGAIEERHLARAPHDAPANPTDRLYALNEYETPAEVLRAVRELIAHLGLAKRPLLAQRAYLLTAGASVILHGFQLDQLRPDDVVVEVWGGDDFAPRVPGTLLDARRLRFVAPALPGGLPPGGVKLRVLSGLGVAAHNFITNAVTATYQVRSKGGSG